LRRRSFGTIRPHSGGDEIYALAIDRDGDFFGAQLLGTVVHYGHDGAVLETSASLVSGDNLVDIDVSADGTLVVGSRFGGVFVVARSLDNFTSFHSGAVDIYVQFVPEPGTGLLVIAGLLGLAGWRRARN
jgi:PEP-CTERM motif